MLPVPALQLLHQLRLRGTLTSAAEALHLSRSAASHQLAGLQRAAGVALTEKVGRGIRLTEAGRQLAEQAQRVLQEMENTTAVAEGLRHDLSGTVHIAAVQTIAISVVPTVVTRLAELHPALRVESHSMDTEDALLAVPAGHIDVAVVPSYDTSPLPVAEGLRTVKLFRDPVRLAVPAGHRLAGRAGAVPVARLSDERWVAGEPDSYFGQLVPSLCREAGFIPDIVHHSSDYAVVASLVSAGHGIAMIPASARLTQWPGITVKTLDAAHTGRDIVALVRAGSVERPTIQAILRAFERHRDDV